VKTVNFNVCQNPPKLIGYHSNVPWTTAKLMSVFSTRCNIYILRLCYDVSVCLFVHLSVTEVHWFIIANLGFKFRSKFTVHCGRGIIAGKSGGIISCCASHCYAFLYNLHTCLYKSWNVGENGLNSCWDIRWGRPIFAVSPQRYKFLTPQYLALRDQSSPYLYTM